MLTVITEGPPNFVTRFTEDRSRGLIVMTSDKGGGGNFAAAIDELTSMDARHKALGFANMHGMGDARINGSPGSPYPINKKGVPLEHVRDKDGNPLPLTDPEMHVGSYRIEVPVTRRLI